MSPFKSINQVLATERDIGNKDTKQFHSLWGGNKGPRTPKKRTMCPNDPCKDGCRIIGMIARTA